jgi:protein-serine/threonine kinase
MVALKMVEAVNRSELKSHCFELETTKKKIYIACRSDEELYSWMDEIYNVSDLKKGERIGEQNYEMMV